MKTKPHVAITVMVYFLAVLSAAAGVPKLLQMPQELEFLQSIGFSPTVVSMLGMLQLAGGILMFWEKFRLPGAAIVGVGFLVSSVAIFLGGNTSFGLISLVPVLVAVIIIRSLLKGRQPGDA